MYTFPANSTQPPYGSPFPAPFEFQTGEVVGTQLVDGFWHVLVLDTVREEQDWSQAYPRST
jgi:hypothetical protein